MSKTKIIIFSTGTIFAILLGALVFHLVSFRSVSIKTGQTDFTADIYKADDTNRERSVASSKEGESIRLQDGDYIAVASNDKFSKDPLAFIVTKDTKEVTLQASLSSATLSVMLSNEFANLKRVLITAYPQLSKGYKINLGKLYRTGEWYATTLPVIPDDPREDGDIYRVVMKKENDTWKVVKTPALVLTASEYPTVPPDILQEVNKLSATE